MKLPLHVVRVPTKYSPLRYIPIADANHFIVCDVLVRDGAEEFADELVRKYNEQSDDKSMKRRWRDTLRSLVFWKAFMDGMALVPVWHKLFGPPRDAKQRAYDAWIAERDIPTGPPTERVFNR
jgi:hypothetical protein